MRTENNEEIMNHNLEKPDKMRKKIILSVALIITAGILSGYLLSKSSGKSAFHLSSGSEPQEKKNTVGSDNKIFRDQAEGQLESGGIDGEGTHKLERPGGDSQTVYLTSSVMDLNQFIGKKVRVWGETYAAKKAGWLMDVGRVETVE